MSGTPERPALPDFGRDDILNLDGPIYTIPREHNMVAFKVKLHIHPGRKIRVSHREEFICELACSEHKAKPVAFFDGPRRGGIILAV